MFFIYDYAPRISTQMYVSLISIVVKFYTGVLPTILMKEINDLDGVKILSVREILLTCESECSITFTSIPIWFSI